MTSLFRSLVAASVFAMAGCNGSTTDVSGKVTFNGKPVVYGTVVLVGSDGLARSGAIQPDGTYRVKDVPVGSARVAVTSPRPPGSTPAKKAIERGADVTDDKPQAEPPPPAPPEVIQNWVSLPEKYGDPSKSEITVTVKSGEPANIDLK